MPFSGAGSGTDVDPYQITDVNELQEMGELDILGSYFKLMNNIDASATSGWNGGEGFVPCGDYSNPFTGHLDGNGKTITGLTVNKHQDYKGLFGVMDLGATVDNVGLINCNIRGYQDIGGIAGYIKNSSEITNCYTTGSVGGTIAGTHVGGIVGAVATNSRVYNCYSTASITQSMNWYGGGLVGTLYGGTIEHCYCTGTVSSNRYTGGFVATMQAGTISYCYATGIVNGGSDWLGGFIGKMDGGTIEKCYATGDFNGATQYKGGFIGQLSAGTISNCYAHGDSVNAGGVTVGGFCGQDSGTITNCYSNGVVNGTPRGGLIGARTGSVNNSFYNSTLSGQ